MEIYIYIYIYIYICIYISANSFYLSQCCGLGVPAPKPKPLPFSLHHDVKSLACADDATLALCLDGTVHHWGMSWTPRALPAGIPTRIPELKDVIQIAVTPPGYYHERHAARRPGFSAAAVTRSG